MISRSVSSISRMISGSAPSAISCRPFWVKISVSSMAMASRRSNPSLRAIWFQSRILSSKRLADCWGGLKIHTVIFRARIKVFIGVCSMTAPSVPPSTINKATAFRIVSRWPPSRYWPTMMAPNPISKPSMLRISIAIWTPSVVYQSQ